MIQDSVIIEVGDKILFNSGMSQIIRFISSDGTIEFTNDQSVQFHRLINSLNNNLCRLIKAPTVAAPPLSPEPTPWPWPHPVFPC